MIDITNADDQRRRVLIPVEALIQGMAADGRALSRPGSLP